MPSRLVVDDTRLAVGPVVGRSRGVTRARHLALVGITGTNGKTTTAQIVAALLEARGWPTGVIGTLHGPRTTPEAPDLHAMLAEFVDAGKRAVVHGGVVARARAASDRRHRVRRWSRSPTSDTTISTCTDRPRSTSVRSRRCSRSTFAPVAVINIDDIRTGACSPTRSPSDVGDAAMRVIRSTTGTSGRVGSQDRPSTPTRGADGRSRCRSVATSTWRTR